MHRIITRDAHREICLYFFLTSSAVADSLMSIISYGLYNVVNNEKTQGISTYLSLKAFRMRSTSTSL